MLKRLIGPTNRRIRICVGLMLVGLFCIQCIGPGGGKFSRKAVALDGGSRVATPELRKLAQKDHIAFLEYCLRNSQKYTHYRCTFIKQEVIGRKVGEEQHIKVKFRRDPFSVAMAWQKNPPMGDRVLYIEGKYGNKMLVRPSGAIARALAPTVLRDPNGPDARRSTLRTINMFGFERSLENLLVVYRQAKQHGDLREKLLEDAKVKGRSTFVLARYLPEGKGYPAYKTLIYIDQEHLVPIMVEGFDSSGQYICQYVYTDIEFNPGLTDRDFLPENNDLKSPE